MKINGLNVIDNVKVSRTFYEYFPEVLIVNDDGKSLIWVPVSKLCQCAAVVYDVETAHEIINHCILCCDCKVYASRIDVRLVHYGKCMTIFEESL